MKISRSKIASKLPLPATDKWPEGVWSIEAFNHGMMKLKYFSPRGKDYQTPHEQDELYIVTQGKGEFVTEESRYKFESGDVLFIEAGRSHRFENFSKDFETWVVFWGPKGGE